MSLHLGTFKILVLTALLYSGMAFSTAVAAEGTTASKTDQKNTKPPATSTVDAQRPADTAPQKPEGAPSPMGNPDNQAPVMPGQTATPAPVAESADPFSYNFANDNGEEFVSIAPGQVPSGIRVLAILHLKGSDSPLAVLDIPGSSSEDLHFVRENDVLQIEKPMRYMTKKTKKQKSSENKNAASSGTASLFATSAGSDDHIYLLISKISKNEVEIAPQARPNETTILR